ncbi:glycosyltransferase [Xanthobacter dioxanivorans]|uniref:Glycosyltransferase n=1 Tax=Xanthobacter dioxanivorans TaxID=2528964 RepID=A0A974PMK8_9HYPH|nr:glycosyltransferase [Xanthobacter dioxanivorans]QRG05974.1 glycosyltransferase [Xanthobacter dioxanivorans]
MRLPDHPRKIAIVHDWLATYTGAERCLEQMLLCYPDAVVFALFDVLPAGQRAFLGGRQPRTTFMQRLPFLKKHYRTYLPLMPLAVEQLDMSGFDLVISSSWALAKGVVTGPDQLHVCYCYTPIRYAWELQHRYLEEAGIARGMKSMLVRIFLHYIRLWDCRTCNSVDRFIAISEFIGRRIWKVYRRRSAVIHPPVNIEYFSVDPVRTRGDYYVTASRMVPYKMIHKIIEAFRALPDRRLVVIGDGPDMGLCRKAAGPNVEIRGYLPLDAMRDEIQGARAFLFMAEEDFGIAPVEAQACGIPVIAFGKGGVLDSMRGLDAPEPTGVFFDEQTPQALADAVRLFESNSNKISSEACRLNAERFSAARYRAQFVAEVDRAWAEYQRSEQH